jgi:Tfp pilus assembly protein PilO
VNLKLGRNLETANILMALGLVLITGLALFEMLFPLSTPSRLARQMDGRLAQARRKAVLSSQKLAELQGSRSVQVHQSSRDAMMPAILAQAAATARQQGLSVESFRPQKVVEAAGLERLTYSLNVKGAFPKVAGLIRSLDRGQDRIALTQFQISATDSKTDAVSAVLNLSAFRDAPLPAPLPARNSAQSGAPRRGESQ